MDTNTPKISIITICLNNLEGLKKTVESVLVQDYPALEYIAIDGDSKDGSKEYLGLQSKHFYFWISEPDGGIYDAQNKGILQATGDYCLFLNAGDYLAKPDIITRFFKRANRTDLVYGNILFDRGLAGLHVFKQPSVLDLSYLLKASPQHPVTFIKRELFIKHGLYDTNFKIASDYDFFLKVLLLHNVSSSHVDIELVVFNTEGISSSPKYTSLEISERKRAQLNYLSPIVLDHFYLRNEIEQHIPSILFENSIKGKFFKRLTKFYFKLISFLC